MSSEKSYRRNDIIDRFADFLILFGGCPGDGRTAFMLDRLMNVANNLRKSDPKPYSELKDHIKFKRVSDHTAEKITVNEGAEILLVENTDHDSKKLIIPNDLKVHHEWIIFFRQMAYNLCDFNKVLNEEDSDPNSDASLLKSIQFKFTTYKYVCGKSLNLSEKQYLRHKEAVIQLKDLNHSIISDNVKDRATVLNFVAVILSKIATFKANGKNNLDFVEDQKDLGNITHIDYKPIPLILYELGIMTNTNKDKSTPSDPWSSDDVALFTWEQYKNLNYDITFRGRSYQLTKSNLKTKTNIDEKDIGKVPLPLYYYNDCDIMTFSFKPNQRMYDIEMKQVVDEVAGISKILLEDYSDGIQQRKYGYYSRNNAGELILIGEDKAETNVDIRPGTSKRKENLLKIMEDESKCDGIPYTNDGNFDCAAFIDDCLQANSLKRCKAILKDKNFWSQSAEQIKEMNPYKALKALMKFQFKTTTRVCSITKLTIREVMTYEEWIADIKEKAENQKNDKDAELNPEDANKIASNEALAGFLKMLIEKINSNPIILNPDYPKSEISIYNPNRFRGSFFFSRGVNANIPIKYIKKNLITNADIAQLQHMHAIAARQNRIGVLQLVQPGFQLGGTDGGMDDQFYTPYIYKNDYAWVTLKTLVDGVISDLERRGKRLHNNDKKQIYADIDKLKGLERKLTLITRLMSKYLEMFNFYGPHKNILKADDIKEFATLFTKTADKSDRLTGNMFRLLFKINPINGRVSVNTINNVKTVPNSIKNSQYEDLTL